MASAESGMTIAVTGPTGTLGLGLIPLLQADDRVRRIVGVARRPFDPGTRGWSKMVYQQGDVRDPASLESAFRGADAVIHLAFLVMDDAAAETMRKINVDGTVNAFRAAHAAGARRFVHASSVAAYGFHRDNPIGMTEQWPARPAAKLFYARQKAELEYLLRDEATAHPEVALYVLRPSIVVGPHTLGAKNPLPGPLTGIGQRLVGLAGRLRLPLLVPVFPFQLVHEQDVGQALLLCAVGAGPAGVYNIAGDGVLSTVDLAAELGCRPLPIPAGLMRSTARAVSALPSLPCTPSVAQWIEVVSHPAIMEVSKAKRELGWQPRYTARQALRDALHDIR